MQYDKLIAQLEAKLLRQNEATRTTEQHIAALKAMRDQSNASAPLQAAPSNKK